MTIRLIMQTSENGEEEYVQFSDDFDTELEYFRNPDCNQIEEFSIDINLPGKFPMNTDLRRT